jgi:hypothetical protein
MAEPECSRANRTIDAGASWRQAQPFGKLRIGRSIWQHRPPATNRTSKPLEASSKLKSAIICVLLDACSGGPWG